MLQRVLPMVMLQAYQHLIEHIRKSCLQDMASFRASPWEQLSVNTVKFYSNTV